MAEKEDFGASQALLDQPQSRARMLWSSKLLPHYFEKGPVL